MTTGQSMLSQHTGYGDWQKKLGFYKQDLAVWQNRLKEIGSKYTSQEVMAELEQFQNQSMIQGEQIDELNHQVGLNKQAIEASILQNATASDHRAAIEDPHLIGQLQRFEELFAAFRKNIMAFLSKWM